MIEIEYINSERVRHNNRDYSFSDFLDHVSKNGYDPIETVGFYARNMEEFLILKKLADEAERLLRAKNQARQSSF